MSGFGPIIAGLGLDPYAQYRPTLVSAAASAAYFTELHRYGQDAFNNMRLSNFLANARSLGPRPTMRKQLGPNQLAWCALNIPGFKDLCATAINPHRDTNRRLTQAAPDLLEALECIIGKTDEGMLWSDRCAKVKAAIAKARGDA